MKMLKLIEDVSDVKIDEDVKNFTQQMTWQGEHSIIIRAPQVLWPPLPGGIGTLPGTPPPPPTKGLGGLN